MHRYFVYIMASRSRALYVGVTGNLMARVWQHHSGTVEGFTSHCRTVRLVHCEETDYVHAALAREKQIKGWSRARKIDLIEQANPTWEDLTDDWYAAGSGTADSSLRSE